MAQKIIVLNDESVNIVRVSLEHKKSFHDIAGLTYGSILRVYISPLCPFPSQQHENADFATIFSALIRHITL